VARGQRLLLRRQPARDAAARVVDFLAEAGHDRAAVSVDARSAAVAAAAPKTSPSCAAAESDCRVLYLEANSPTLLRRFSETRRRPLSFFSSLILPLKSLLRRKILLTAPPSRRTRSPASENSASRYSTRQSTPRLRSLAMFSGSAATRRFLHRRSRVGQRSVRRASPESRPLEQQASAEVVDAVVTAVLRAPLSAMLCRQPGQPAHQDELHHCFAFALAAVELPFRSRQELGAFESTPRAA